MDAQTKYLNCKLNLSKNTDVSCMVPRPVLKEKIENLNTLIEELQKLFEHDGVYASEVEALMLQYESNKTDWERYAFFNSKGLYTRNLVDEGNGKYNLILLCWNPNRESPPHDHSDSHCFMKILDGSLKEVRYEQPKSEDNNSSNINQCGNGKDNEINACCKISAENKVKPNICDRIVGDGAKKEQNGEVGAMEGNMIVKSTKVLKVNDVHYINDDQGVHKMQNTENKGAVSLHLYCPPFGTCKVFDKNGKASVAEVTYYSKYGVKNNN
ncbi:cysteine dioxygenase-like [Achroia grisella]|uniref:cysteine dioxygenase-like n=1 Tax=Achroia grisella TaxID=688607 RepID=UPI0027D2DDA7|nr:cysteine dioxygenase-like [Achroia grisella]